MQPCSIGRVPRLLTKTIYVARHAISKDISALHNGELEQRHLFIEELLPRERDSYTARVTRPLLMIHFPVRRDKQRGGLKATGAHLSLMGFMPDGRYSYFKQSPMYSQ